MSAGLWSLNQSRPTASEACIASCSEQPASSVLAARALILALTFLSSDFNAYPSIVQSALPMLYGMLWL